MYVAAWVFVIISVSAYVIVNVSSYYISVSAYVMVNVSSYYITSSAEFKSLRVYWALPSNPVVLHTSSNPVVLHRSSNHLHLVILAYAFI